MKHYNVKYSNFIVNSLDEYIRLDPNHEFGWERKSELLETLEFYNDAIEQLNIKMIFFIVGKNILI